MKTFTKRTLLILILFIANPLFAQNGNEYGPANGSLVIAGGALKDVTVYNKFIELAGGKDANFVIVPTAGGNIDKDGNIRVFDEERILSGWKKRGLTNVTMLHTHDPKVADTDEFVAKLKNANAVWFNGGRQWNIVDSYAGTMTFDEFHKVLERGGVIGGSSAGATIQGRYLVRGDTEGSNVVMTDEKDHFWGFSFLKKSAIDQHIDARGRWDHIIPVIEKYPGLLGIGLSENTAIIVTGDKFEVMGNYKVAIHDNTKLYQPWEKPYYVIGPGAIYNMKTRQIERLDKGRPYKKAEIESEAKVYVCPPCGHSGHDMTFNRPGFCSDCNRELTIKDPHDLNSKEIIQKYLNNPNILFLDVRSADEFKGVRGNYGKIKGALNIHVNELSDRLSELEKYKDKEIVTYCTHSIRSTRAKVLLRDNGFKKVFNLVQGVNSWNKDAETKLLKGKKLYIEKK